MTSWQEHNLAAIKRRLAAARRAPTGLLFEQVSPHNHILVRRSDDQLLLCYRHTRGKMEEIQSRLSLSDPLSLLSDYTQAMLLTLAWRPDPQRVLLVGLGGGRLQMIVHHYLEQTQLDTVELDAAVLDVARRFFAFLPDDRQHVIVQDGREYLRETNHLERYDLIFLDAYHASGVPLHLSTQEFYDECRAHLTDGGVVVTNLHASTSVYDAVRKTFALAFRQTMAFRLLGGNIVVIGTDGEQLSVAEVCQRATAVQERYGFDFALPQIAKRQTSGAPYRQSAPVLRDAYTPVGGVISRS
ncbi:MAG: fused MFS/spermidine synthase [Deltaproteobacteria bacterium]|nr:fused MFS/spermidine synthase [Deltaproteobacteria bacterium]